MLACSFDTDFNYYNSLLFPGSFNELFGRSFADKASAKLKLYKRINMAFVEGTLKEAENIEEFLIIIALVHRGQIIHESGT